MFTPKSSKPKLPDPFDFGEITDETSGIAKIPNSRMIQPSKMTTDGQQQP